MKCLNGLISNHFLRNIGDEIKRARNTLEYKPMQTDIPSFMPARLPDRKKLYNRYMELYDIKSNFDDIDVDDLDLVYYLEERHIVWIASRHKMIIDKAIQETAYTTGDLCIHSCKHYINNKVVYAAMFDTFLGIVPPTTN